METRKDFNASYRIAQMMSLNINRFFHIDESRVFWSYALIQPYAFGCVKAYGLKKRCKMDETALVFIRNVLLSMCFYHAEVNYVR